MIPFTQTDDTINDLKQVPSSIMGHDLIPSTICIWPPAKKNLKKKEGGKITKFSYDDQKRKKCYSS